eukprot:scaffold13611_cov78-Skeletonema_marinoi.AAC.3
MHSHFNDLLSNPSKCPTAKGKGLNVTVIVGPYNRKAGTNVGRRNTYLQQQYGRDIDNANAVDNDNVERYTYGRKKGAQSTGVTSSTFTCLPWSTAIEATADVAQNALSVILEDKGVTLQTLNTATSIIYNGHRQINNHVDNLRKKDGTFDHNGNSQVENTVTCVICFGDTRTLILQQFRNRDIKLFPEDGIWRKGKKNGPQPIGEPISVTLEHGDMFVLMPSDEEYLLRPSYDKCKTYFRHRSEGVHGRDNSIA